MPSPSFTDKVTVVALTRVTNGSVARGTLDLTGKFGAFIFIRVGRLTSTAPATGIRVFVRRQLYDSSNSRDIPHPGALAVFQDTTTAANLTTLNGSPSHPASALTLTSATGFAGDQYVCITNSTSSPTRAEWHHTSKIASTTLTMDRNFANTSIANADTITNQSLVPAAIWVDGGPGATNIEVVFDYGPEANASHVVVEAWAHTYDQVS